MEPRIVADEPRKIVIIADWMVEYLSQEHYLFGKKLEKHGWTTILLSEMEVDAITCKKSVVLCLTADLLDISALRHENVALIYRLNDIIPPTSLRTKCFQAADVVIGPTLYLLGADEVNTHYPGYKSKKLIYTPFTAVNDFYSGINMNMSPISKVLASGCTSRHYPLRNYLIQESGLECVDILEHPGYDSDYRKHDIVTDKYFAKLNEYLCCFVSASIYFFVVQKVFEVCSVGSCLLVDDNIVSQLEELGFVDGTNCITCNRANMMEKIAWVLDSANRSEVDRIRANGMALVRENHNTETRCKNFDEDITGLYSAGNLDWSTDRVLE